MDSCKEEETYEWCDETNPRWRNATVQRKWTCYMESNLQKVMDAARDWVEEHYLSELGFPTTP